MAINPSIIVASSSMDGFKNYDSASFSVSVPSQNLGSLDFVTYTATTPLSNTNSISQVQIQYSGLDSDYYVMYGTMVSNWSSSSYQIESVYYFDTTTLTVVNYIINQTTSTITIPAITINCRGFLFIAPF